MRTIIISLSLLFAFSATAQNIKTWKSYPVPTNPDTLSKYSSYPDWIVTSKNDEIYATGGRYFDKVILPFEIKPEDDREKFFMTGSRRVITVSDGFIVVFFNHRMHILYWFSQDGRDHYFIGFLSHLLDLINMNDAVYALISDDTGRLQKIQRENKRWVICDYFQFPSRPYAMQKDSLNNIYIVTTGGLFSIDEQKNIETLIDVGIWSNVLRPTSIAIAKDYIYIGMQKGVVKYQMYGSEEWLLPE